MLTQILDANQLQGATNKLREKLRTHAYREQQVVWGFPNGGREQLDTFVLRAHSHDIYVGVDDNKMRTDSYAHLFRLVDHHAEPTPAFSPNAEVNVSMTGGRAVGGLFAIEDERVVLGRRAMFNAYRGRIKEADTLEFFGDHTVSVQTGNQEERKVIPVVALDSPTFVGDIEDFVLRVIAFKDYFKAKPSGVDAENNAISIPAQTEHPEHSWPWHDNAEFEGTKSLKARAPVSYEFQHGPLCNRLSSALDAWAKGRFVVRSTKNIDSAIVGSNGIARAIFEVKTAGSLSDQLYKALGQLLHYRWKRGDDDTLLSVVLPGEVKDDAVHANTFLRSQGIHVLYETAPSRYALADGTTLEAFLESQLS
ncbi:hypothetical protein [Cupriavidus pauculus]|uniref:Uncharacterized protein n=1 Tax=Cupriavidus pauculus TaxID=82633 RepID=A0A3G8H033_9BURK|nr:hypothetical protein [Cupriavidus pauculus]AZG13787.1 hypothetical protein EHF44_10180 [Cupriavidus pauculus]